MRFYSMPSPGKEDVEFDLMELERVNIGEPFAVTVYIKSRSDEPRTIQAILSAGSIYYNGVKAHLVKRASGDFVLQPHAGKQLLFSHPNHLRRKPVNIPVNRGGITLLLLD